MQMSKSVLWQDKQASKQTTKKPKTEFNKQAFLRTSDIPDLVQCLKKLKHLSYLSSPRQWYRNILCIET